MTRVKEQLAICDAAIVGVTKRYKKRYGDIYAPYVDSFMKIVKRTER